MNRYNTTYGYKVMQVLHVEFAALVDDIDNLECKEYLKTSIKSNLYRIVNLQTTVPREIVDQYVDLVFLSFHA